MANNYLRNGDASHTRYAIKTLSASLLKDPERYVAGVIDLVIETKFLSIIRHPVSDFIFGMIACNAYSSDLKNLMKNPNYLELDLIGVLVL